MLGVLCRMYKDVPKIMVPMFWFTQRAQLNEELAAQARVRLLKKNFFLYSNILIF